jgi:predicted DNA-binding ribbon-helix-helix protein
MEEPARRNVSIRGHRTSLRLEDEVWEALEEICQLEELTIHQLCDMIDRQRQSLNRTSAIRAFIVGYFRAAATPEGHRLAGHGWLGRAKERAADPNHADVMSRAGVG